MRGIHFSTYIVVVLLYFVSCSSAIACVDEDCGANECCDDLVAGAQCYDPAAYTCNAVSGGNKLCLNSESVCNDQAAGQQCYDPAGYKCNVGLDGNLLCPSGNGVCGFFPQQFCFDSLNYHCVDGSLVQGPAPPQYVAYFDGTGAAFFSTNYPAFTTTNEFTIEVQVNSSSIASMRLFRWRYYAYHVDLINGAFGASAYVSSTSGDAVSSPSGYADNTWHSLAVTRNLTTWALYINGQLINTADSGGSIFFYGTDRAAIAGDGSATGTFYTGEMANFRFWDHVLTAEEVARNFNLDAPFPDTAPGLQLNLRFNGELVNNGTQHKDFSGNGNHVTSTAITYIQA